MDNKVTELTAYQLRFVAEYMKCGNKRKAMLNAGYKGKDKRSTVTSAAAQMYNLPKVKEEIERRRQALADENVIDAKEVLTRLRQELLHPRPDKGQARPYRENHQAIRTCEGLHHEEQEAYSLLREGFHAI